MASSMAVDEADVLYAVRDFLEHSGHVECMRLLEKSTGIYPQDVSEEMQFLRELTLDGHWKEVQAFIEVLVDTEHKQVYNECRYEVIKQQYLETVQGVPSLLEQALKYLDDLNATKQKEEVYSKLEQLLSITSSSKDKSYVDSEIYKSRMQCFRVLMRSMLEVLYPRPIEVTPDPCTVPLSQDRLCLLLLKGRLYEECENKCRERCGRGLPAGVLHLASWIGQLADEAFSQKLFTVVSMIVNPHASVNATRPTETEPTETEPTDCRPAGVGFTTDPPPKNAPLNKDRPHSSGSAAVASHIPKAMSTPAHSSMLRFENNFVQDVTNTQPISALVDTQISSTPKHFIRSAPLPNSSPVPYVPGTHGLHDTPHLSHHAAREWPSPALRGTVTDTQVRLTRNMGQSGIFHSHHIGSTGCSIFSQWGAGCSWFKLQSTENSLHKTTFHFFMVILYVTHTPFY